MGLFSFLFGRKKKVEKANTEPVQETVQSEVENPQPEEVVESAPVADESAPVAAPVECETDDVTEEQVLTEEEPAVSDDAPETATKRKKSAYTGRFEIKRAKDGRYVFNLYASNHVIVATSQIYSAASSAINGINSIIANAEKASVEDTTLKNTTVLPYPKWEIYMDKGNQYRFRLYATNGSCVVHSQGYTTKASCKNGIESIIRCSKNPEIDKAYLKKDTKA